MLKKTLTIALLTILSLVLFSCKKEKKVYAGQDPSVLQGWCEHIILPAYKHYQGKVHKLLAQAKKFDEERSEANLAKLKEAEVETYKALQGILIFNFGYLEDSYLIPLANTYPTKVKHSANELKNARTIEDNIALIKEGKASEILLKQTAASIQHVYQGLPALDYLLFDSEHTLAYYTGVDGDSAAEYIVMLTNFLSETIDEVVSVWDERLLKAYSNDKDGSSNGYYAQTINGFIKAYEKTIRAEKVGYASGSIKSQNGKDSPEIIEAYYNGKIDKELLMLALKSSQDFFNGKYFGSEEQTKSLYSILVDRGSEKLAQRINKQYTLIYQELKAMSLSLKETAVQDNAQLKKLYKLIQKNVANYKTDMLTALNVSVGYQDTDGD